MLLFIEKKYMKKLFFNKFYKPPFLPLNYIFIFLLEFLS